MQYGMVVRHISYVSTQGKLVARQKRDMSRQAISISIMAMPDKQIRDGPLTMLRHYFTILPVLNYALILLEQAVRIAF